MFLNLFQKKLDIDFDFFRDLTCTGHVLFFKKKHNVPIKIEKSLRALIFLEELFFALVHSYLF